MDMDQVTLLYRVRRTVMQMLKDRGYIIQADIFAQTKQKFQETFSGARESLNMLVKRRPPPEGENPLPEESQKLIVFFPD